MNCYITYAAYLLLALWLFQLSTMVKILQFQPLPFITEITLLLMKWVIFVIFKDERVRRRSLRLTNRIIRREPPLHHHPFLIQLQLLHHYLLVLFVLLATVWQVFQELFLPQFQLLLKIHEFVLEITIQRGRNNFQLLGCYNFTYF